MAQTKTCRSPLALLCLALFSTSVVALPQAPSTTSSAPAASNTSNSQAIFHAAHHQYKLNSQAYLNERPGSCSWETARVRRAWDDITVQERQNYIDAVNCVTAKTPARTPKWIAPGARNWLDDFVWSHINQTDVIHIDGLLLPWHRQFLMSLEDTMRAECGYNSTIPYWPWERHSANQALSPVFQSGPASFGGNGAYVPHNATNASLPGFPADHPLSLPRAAGTGGGYITNGAFVDHIINLGPVAPANNTPNNLFGNHYNPRHIKRDFLQSESTEVLTWDSLASLIQMPSIHEFHPALEFGIHGASHSFIGGDAYDLYSSPNDPVFFLLHSQLDRVWSIWQGQDYPSREFALDGTVTMLNDPPSANATLSTIMHMGVSSGGDLPIIHAMSTFADYYCYVYE